MTITIRLRTDNASFESDYRLELAGILRTVVRETLQARSERPRTAQPHVAGLHDSNGNTVGSVTVTGK